VLIKFILALLSKYTAMGRPPTRPITFRDGFYIEVRNKGASSGVKIRSADPASMAETAEQYRRSKEVIILGEFKNGQWVADGANDSSKKSKAKSKPAKKK